MNVDKWIKIIQALTPIILALLEPRLRHVGNMTANMMVEAEKVGGTGPEKLDRVLSETLPIAVKSAPSMTVDHVKDDLTESIKFAVATANMMAADKVEENKEEKKDA